MTTPDGQRPDNPWISVPSEYTIITPYMLELDGAIALNELGANLSNGRVVIATEGGQVGQDAVRNFAPTELFVVGQRVLIALTNEYAYNEDIEMLFSTSEGPAWSVATKYLITEDGMAVDRAGSQPLEELIAAILTASDTDVLPSPTMELEASPPSIDTVESEP